MAELKQYGILVMGLLIGGGFAFGGIASYAGITGGGSSQGDGETFNTTLPSQGFSDGSYGLSSREQRYIAARNNVVFVTGFYDNRSQKQRLEKLKSLRSKFNNRVYISLVNSSESSDILIQYAITEFPKVVVIGGNRNYRPEPLEDVSRRRVSREVCSAFDQLGGLAAVCTV